MTAQFASDLVGGGFGMQFPDPCVQLEIIVWSRFQRLSLLFLCLALVHLNSSPILSGIHSGGPRHTDILLDRLEHLRRICVTLWMPWQKCDNLADVEMRTLVASIASDFWESLLHTTSSHPDTITIQVTSTASTLWTGAEAAETARHSMAHFVSSSSSCLANASRLRGKGQIESEFHIISFFLDLRMTKTQWRS